MVKSNYCQHYVPPTYPVPDVSIWKLDILKMLFHLDFVLGKERQHHVCSKKAKLLCCHHVGNKSASLCVRGSKWETHDTRPCVSVAPSLSLSLCYAHSHQPDASVYLGASLSPSHHHSAIHLLPIILSSLCTICVRERARAAKAKEGWWWIMCANLSGIILFSVTSTQRSSVSSYVSSSPFFSLSLSEAFLLSRKLLQTFTLLHLLSVSFIYLSIRPCIHASLGWQWCRAEKPWIIYQAGLFSPALLPTFGLPRRWGTFGEVHATHTRKDIINNHRCVDCRMHVCLVKQPENVVVGESVRFRLLGDDW